MGADMRTVLLSEVVVYLVRGWVYFYTSGLPTAVRDARRQEIDSDLWEHERHGTLSGRSLAETAVEVLARLLIGIPADLVWRWEQRTTNAGTMPASAGEGREDMDRAVGQRWVLVVPVLLAVGALAVGVDNMVDAGENTLREVLGSHLGAGITGGFIPAALLIVGLVRSWRTPTIGVAVTLGLVFLYFALLMAWMGLRGGWVAEGLVSLLGAAGAALYLTGLAVSRRSPQLGGALAMIGAVPMAVTLWWSLFMPILALLLGAFGLHRARRLAATQRALS
jgi:hypothetical protein